MHQNCWFFPDTAYLSNILRSRKKSGLPFYVKSWSLRKFIFHFNANCYATLPLSLTRLKICLWHCAYILRRELPHLVQNRRDDAVLLINVFNFKILPRFLQLEDGATFSDLVNLCLYWLLVIYAFIFCFYNDCLAGDKL